MLHGVHGYTFVFVIQFTGQTPLLCSWVSTGLDSWWDDSNRLQCMSKPVWHYTFELSQIFRLLDLIYLAIHFSNPNRKRTACKMCEIKSISLKVYQKHCSGAMTFYSCNLCCMSKKDKDPEWIGKIQDINQDWDHHWDPDSAVCHLHSASLQHLPWEPSQLHSCSHSTTVYDALPSIPTPCDNITFPGFSSEPIMCQSL